MSFVSCRSCHRVDVSRPIIITRPVTVIDCPAPVLTVGFPPICPGPNTVTLANGAVVDLGVLSGIITQFCPSLVCATPPFTPVLGPFLDP